MKDAVGVAAREMGDLQLALWLARLLQPDLVPGLLEAQLDGTLVHCTCSTWLQTSRRAGPAVSQTQLLRDLLCNDACACCRG